MIFDYLPIGLFTSVALLCEGFKDKLFPLFRPCKGLKPEPLPNPPNPVLPVEDIRPENPLKIPPPSDWNILKTKLVSILFKEYKIHWQLLLTSILCME